VEGQKVRNKKTVFQVVLFITFITVLWSVSITEAASSLPDVQDALSARPTESFYMTARVDDIGGAFREIFSQTNVDLLASLIPHSDTDQLRIAATIAYQIPAKSAALVLGFENKDLPFFQLAVSVQEDLKPELDRVEKGEATPTDIATLLMGKAGLQFAGSIGASSSQRQHGLYYTIDVAGQYLLVLAARNNLLLLAFSPDDLEASIGALERTEDRLAIKRRFNTPDYFFIHDIKMLATISTELGYDGIESLSSLFKEPLEIEAALEAEPGKITVSAGANILDSIVGFKDHYSEPSIGANLFLVGSGKLFSAFAVPISFKASDLRKYPEIYREWNSFIRNLAMTGITERNLEDLLTGTFSFVLGNDSTIMGKWSPGGYIALSGRGGAAAKILNIIIGIASDAASVGGALFPPLAGLPSISIPGRAQPFISLSADGWDPLYMVNPMILPLPLLLGASGDTLFLGLLDPDGLGKKPEFPSEAAQILTEPLITWGFIDAAAICNWLREELSDEYSPLGSLINQNQKTALILRNLLQSELSVPFIKKWVPDVETIFTEYTITDVPLEKRLFNKILALSFKDDTTLFSHVRTAYLKLQTAVSDMCLSIIMNDLYAQAEAALSKGDYQAATEGFKKLGRYKGAHIRVLSITYAQAEAALSKGDYQTAIDGFKELGDFRDARSRILDVHYAQAEAAFSKGDYQTAIDGFKELGNHKDAQTRVLDVHYAQAEALFSKGDYQAAINGFSALGNYRDAKEKLDKVFELVREHVLGHIAEINTSTASSQDYDSAINALKALLDQYPALNTEIGAEITKFTWEIVTERITEINTRVAVLNDYDEGINALKSLRNEYPAFSTEIDTEIMKFAKEIVVGRIADINARVAASRDYDGGITELKSLLNEYPAFSMEINTEITKFAKEIVTGRIAEINTKVAASRDYDSGITTLKNLLNEYPAFNTEINAEIAKFTTDLIRIVQFRLDRSSIVLANGASATLSVITNPANVKNLEYTWESSDSSIATVNNGQVTAKGFGAATISLLTANGMIKATCEVNINAFLGRDIKAYQLDRRMKEYPNSGSFKMVGVSYVNGVTGSGSGAKAYYNVGGQYKYLSGIYGPVDGNIKTHVRGSSNINIYGDGKLLSELKSIMGNGPQSFSVDIKDVSIICIEIMNATNNLHGLANAMVSNSQVSVSSDKPNNVFSDNAYLGKDIKPYQTYEMLSYPDDGSFKMAGVSYVNGVSNRNRHVDVGKAYYNVDGQYANLSGIYGPVDGTTSGGRNINIYGDGKLLTKLPSQARNSPKSFSVDITGVSIIYIEIIPIKSWNTSESRSFHGLVNIVLSKSQAHNSQNNTSSSTQPTTTTKQSATIKGNSVRIRSTPNTSNANNTVYRANDGHSVTIIEKRQVNNYLWYLVEYQSGQQGWVRSDLLTIN